MSGQTKKPRPPAPLIKSSAVTVFKICVGTAIALAFLFALAATFNFIGNKVGETLAWLSERILPAVTRDVLLWFADDVLPQIGPAIKWMNVFGANWNGFLTVSAFVLAVLGIVLTVVLAPDSKNEK